MSAIECVADFGRDRAVIRRWTEPRELRRYGNSISRPASNFLSSQPSATNIRFFRQKRTFLPGSTTNSQMMKVSTASPIRRTVSAMTRNRVIYAVVGVAWVGVGLSWVGTALVFLDGNSNASFANAVGATFSVAFMTAVVYFWARALCRETGRQALWRSLRASAYEAGR
jgi:hypothetical protein